MRRMFLAERFARFVGANRGGNSNERHPDGSKIHSHRRSGADRDRYSCRTNDRIEREPD